MPRPLLVLQFASKRLCERTIRFVKSGIENLRRNCWQILAVQVTINEPATPFAKLPLQYSGIDIIDGFGSLSENVCKFP